MSKNNVPVLLIGLGGIGCSIVDKTYGRLKKEGGLDFLEALVFDTDQGEMVKLENVPNECKIQTSTDKSVKYVLERDENATLWFPSHPRILNMQLINGAGQIRAVSRLALRSAMKAGRLNYVQSVKDRIYKLGGNAAEKGVRIMIVASMMGGTGSGMFLQIPLYLREVFQSKFGADRIEIQGTFLLPDVLKGSIDEKQKMNVYANAYAAMKELNAINMSLSGSKVSVNLEYRPDQIEKTRDIAVKNWPYDYCFIYDKEDTKGRVLDTLEDYKSMVSENLYSQVFGPISDQMYSYFINTVRETIRKGSRNIYGGIGIGKLIYPYEDICEFITCKAVNESLKDQLLRINTSFKMKMDQYDRNKQAGNDTEKPVLAEHYIDEFRALAKTDNFFKNVYKQIVTGDEESEKPLELVDDYINEIEHKAEVAVEDFVANNNITQPNRSSIDNKVEGELKNIVDKYEESYRMFRQAIDSRMDSIGETAANNDFEIYDDKKESFFDRYLKDKERNYVNPVGIRYILYSIKQYMDDEKSALNADIEDKKGDLKKKEERKLSGVFKNIDNLQAALDHAINSDHNPVDKLTFKSMQKFKEAYCEEATKHYRALKEYCLMVYRHAYFRRTLEMLNVLIGEYENMFDRLEDQRIGMEKKINELLHKYEGNIGKINIYILGKPDFKEKIWDSIPANTRLNTLSNVLPEKMHENLKVNCKQIIKNQKNNVVGYDVLFNTLIMEGCKNSLKENKSINELIDMNVVNAIVKEYEYAKEFGIANDIKDKDQYIKDRLNDIIERTQPFTPQSEETTDNVIWGINNNLRLPSESMSDKPKIENLINEISQKISSKRICADETYSQYEITYLISRYGLEVSDFRKFFADDKGEDDGEYYSCYQKVIKDVTDNNMAVGRNIEITPHIDKKWHKILPDLNESENLRSKKDNAKAFIIGLAMNYIDVQEKKIGENKTRLEFLRTLGLTTPTTISANGEKVQGNLSRLFEGLQYNPDIIEDIVEEIKNHISEIRDDVDVSSEKVSLSDDKIIKSLYATKINCYDDISGALDILIKLYPECRTREENERHEIFDTIIENLCSTIEDIVKAYYGSEQEIVNENAKDVLNKIINTSRLAKELDKKDEIYNYTIAPLLKKIEQYEGK